MGKLLHTNINKDILEVLPASLHVRNTQQGTVWPRCSPDVQHLQLLVALAYWCLVGKKGIRSGEWKTKWKLLHYNRVYIEVIVGNNGVCII